MQKFCTISLMQTDREDKAFPSVGSLIEALGRPYVRRVCRVSNSAISTWIRDGVIAADRYDSFCAMCREKKQPDPPRSLFTFKQPQLPEPQEHSYG